jgi:hypothetical protein
MPRVTLQRSAHTVEEARQYIADLYQDNKERYVDDYRGLGDVGELQQLFQKWHYVAELLQNALDEDAKRIHLVAGPEQLIFEHDGNPFEVRHVCGLCNKGLSAKGARTVGFMGLGFKSVFHSYERAAVSSGVWRFFLEVPQQIEEQYHDSHLDWTGCFLPRWDAGLTAPSPKMKCRFVFTGRRGGAIADDLAQVLGPDDALLALLAWRGVQELHWGDRQWSLSATPTPLDKWDRRLILTARDQHGPPRNWVLFEREYQPSDTAIKAFLSHRRILPNPGEREKVYSEAARPRHVALFCSLQDGRPEPVGKRGRVYSMLPTNVTMPLGMHLQADWLLNTSREELIHRNNNAWHEDIRGQIPCLLRRVMEWTAEMGRQGVVGWQRGYDALPEAPADGSRDDGWLIGPEFEAGLADELQSLPAFPLPPEDGRPAEFSSPDQTRLLPSRLAELFEESPATQRLLFGARAISASLLGERALRCLDRLGLLTKLAPAEVEAHWQDGKAVAAWLASVAKKEQDATLVRLLEALAELDEDEKWKEADLVCLPTEGRGWTSRTGLLRFPRNWDAVRADKHVREALLPCAGPLEQLLAWRFDAHLIRTRTRLEYLRTSRPQQMKAITDRWWEQMPEVPSEEQAELVLYFTNWVRKKMPRVSGLVNKVLARFPRKRKLLLDGNDVLLADPYASAHRRMLFEDVPAVIHEYLDVDAEADATDWRAFFESVAVAEPVKGALLRFEQENLTKYALHERIGEDQELPPLGRRNWLSGMSWNPQRYRFRNYLINPDLRKRLTATLARRDLLLAFAEALNDETRDYLGSRARPRIDYYVTWKKDHESQPLPCRAGWLNQLAEMRWVFAGEKGPFRPCELLPPGAPAEDGAPVATLPPGLAEKLPALEFRKPLADASAVERLQMLGPLMDDATQLAALLDAAREECGEPDGDRQALLDALAETALFPARDGTPRRYDRLIGPKPRQTAVRRASDLGGFLLWVDHLSELVASAVERLREFDESLRIPELPGAAQVMAFVRDVWETVGRAPERPADESLAQNLALAYRYLAEDLEAEGDEVLREEWEQARQRAMVFADRRWVPVTDAVFDDLNETDLRKLMPAVAWAIGAPLGNTLDERKRSARLLGLRLLSQQVRREAVLGDPLDGSEIEGWCQRFARLAVVLGRLQEPERSQQTSPGESPRPLELRVVRSLSLRTTWKAGANERPITAWLAVGAPPQGLYVAGSPLEFSLDTFDLLLRRFPALPGGAAFAGRLSLLLAHLGDAEVFERLLETVCVEYDVDFPPTEAPRGGQEETDGEPAEEAHGHGTEKTSPTRQGGKRRAGGSSGGGAGSGASPKGGDPGRRGPGERGDGAGAGTRGGQEGRLFPGTGANPECPPPSQREQHDDRRGRDAVRRYETEHGRLPGPELPALNEGFDLTSEDRNGGVTRHIEVKGIGNWDTWPVSLTAPQFLDSFLEPDDPGVEYWLYVVDDVNSDRPRVFGFRKAAQRVQRFFFRADTWRELADEQDDVELPVEPLADTDPLPDMADSTDQIDE